MTDRVGSADRNIAKQGSNAQADQSTDVAASAVTRIERLQERCDAYAEQIARLNESSVALDRRYKKIIESTSWRITKPLRSLSLLIKGKKTKDPSRGKRYKKNKTLAERGIIAAKQSLSPGAKESLKKVVATVSPGLAINLAEVGYGPKPLFLVLQEEAQRDITPIVTFGITLASAQSVGSWEHTKTLLAGTLRSLFNQTDNRFRIVICGHEKPDIPEISHPSVTFLSIRTQPPTAPNKFRADKRMKRHALGMYLRDLGGGFFMQLDADDLVHCKLVERIGVLNPDSGVIITKGYAYDWSNGKFALVPGVWGVDFDRICGSCAVVKYTVEDLPDVDTSPNVPTLPFNMTRQHAYIRVAIEELGRPLAEFDDPMMIYVVNHSQNLSFAMQKRDVRGENIVKRVRENAVSDEKEISLIKRNFGIDY